MAYNSGGFQHPHQDETHDPQVARNDGPHGGGGGGEVIETQTSGGDEASGDGAAGGDLTTVNGVPTNQQFASNGPGKVYGPGDDRGDSGPAGFMPNGEDGLMTLASYAQTQGGEGGAKENSTNNSDHMPGGGPADPGTPGPSGQTGQGQGAKVADAGGSSPGSGEGSGGGFGLGGGGAGGGLFPTNMTGGDSGSTTGGSGGGGTGSGGGGDPTGGGGNSGPSGGATVCVVTALTSCGGSDPQTPTPGSPTPTVTLTPGGGGFGGQDGGFTPGPVPEPSAWVLMIVGFGGLGSVLRAKRRKALA